MQRIREGSIIHQIQIINVGDMIESINGQTLIGCRHYEVAKMLKELPRGKDFVLKLVEPLKAFGMCVCVTVISQLMTSPAPLPYPKCSRTPKICSLLMSIIFYTFASLLFKNLSYKERASRRCRLRATTKKGGAYAGLSLEICRSIDSQNGRRA